MARAYLLLLAAACVVGCGSGRAADPGTVSVRELVAEAPNGAATVDIRHSSATYVVESGTDISNTTIICPNGASMRFSSWVEARSKEFSTNYSAAGFSVRATAPIQSTSAGGATTQLTAPPNCEAPCTPCSDGGCICPIGGGGCWRNCPVGPGESPP